MKKSLILFLIILLANYSFSQNQDSLQEMAKQAVKMFTWDVQKVDKGALMFLDVPYYQDNQDSVEYLTLTVAKDNSKNRPDFISVIIPSNISKTNGIFLKFANDEMEKGNPYRVNFENCDKEICAARLVNGYFINEKTNEQIDIFQKFLDFKHVYFLFIYPDGSHKTVAVPLFSFKEQYSKL